MYSQTLQYHYHLSKHFNAHFQFKQSENKEQYLPLIQQHLLKLGLDYTNYLYVGPPATPRKTTCVPINLNMKCCKNHSWVCVSLSLSSTWSSSSHLSARSSWISTHLDLPALFCICTLLFTVSSIPPLHVSSSGHSQQHQWLAPTLTSHHFTWAFNFCPSKPHSSNDLRLIFHIWLLMVKMQGCINIIDPYWLAVSMFHWRLYNQQRLFLDDMMLAVRLVLLYLQVFVSQLRICCCVILSMMQKGHRGH